MYRNIDARIWTDQITRKLPIMANYLFMYLITNPHSHLSGLYYLPLCLAKKETRLDNGQLDEGIGTLSRANLIEYDEENEIVWVKNMLRYQACGGKSVRSAEMQLQNLAGSYLVDKFLKKYPKIAIPKRYPNDTQSEAILQDQDQEKDQYQDQEKEKEQEGRKKQRPAQATPVPDQFSVSDSLKEWASKTVRNIDLDTETQKFVDHYLSTGEKRVDWGASWRKWMRNAAEWGQARNNGQRGPATDWDKLIAEEDERQKQLEAPDESRKVAKGHK